MHCILAQNFTASLSSAGQYKPQHWPVFSKHYFWLRVCTCNAELSCSTAFPTGYASRRSSSYKSQEQLFRVHFGCSARFKRSVYYSCKMFPSFPLFGDDRGLGLFCAMPSNKLGTLLGSAVKFAPRLPPSLLAALPFNISCKPILQSDPARAVLHSARSAGEISEVVWSRHRRKSHRLTLRKAVLPHLTPTCHYLFYN